MIQISSKTPPFQLKESKDRGHCVFPKEHPKVNDGKDHFPINDINHARNALAQAGKYDKAPEWYDGSLKDLLKTIRSTIEKEFPSIEVSETLEESLARTQSLFISLNEAQRNEFQSSIVRGGSIIPEIVVIEDGVLTWSKRKINLIGKDVKSVKVSEVTQMNLNIGIIGTDFTIYTKGNNTIEGHNFSKKDAMAIKKLLKV